MRIYPEILGNGYFNHCIVVALLKKGRTSQESRELMQLYKIRGYNNIYILVL